MTQLKTSDSKLIFERYKKLDTEYKNQEYSSKPFSPDCGITDKEISEFIDFLEGHEFTLYDIRYCAIKLAMKYKFSIDSFWEFIQVKRGVWKKL